MDNYLLKNSLINTKPIIDKLLGIDEFGKGTFGEKATKDFEILSSEAAINAYVAEQLAEQNKMVGFALRAEELRGKVAGYYIDRQIIKNKNGPDYDSMSSEELEEAMNKMLLDYEHILTPKGKDLVERKQKHNEEQRKKNGKTNGSNE